MQFVRNQNVNRTQPIAYSEVFWPVTVTFLVLLISIVVLIGVYDVSKLNIVAPFVRGVAALVQALTPMNIWQALAAILLASIILLEVFFSVYDRGDGFWITLGKTLVFFITAVILIGTVYSVVTNRMSLSQLLQFFGPLGSIGAIVGIIIFSLVLVFMPARYISSEQRPLEQPGYLFVGCASVIMGVGLLLALIGAIFNITTIYHLVVDHIVIPLVEIFQSMNVWQILSTIASIILLVIANFRIVFVTVRGKALQEGNGSGPALRRTLLVLTIEAILITVLYRAVHAVQPLLQILTQWNVNDQEILSILLSVTILLIMNVYASINIHRSKTGSNDFRAYAGAFLLFLVLGIGALSIVYSVVHGFVSLVHSWETSLPILVAVTSALVNIVIILDKDQYLAYLFGFALVLLGAAYLLGAAFVILAPNLLGLTYFIGSWWIAFLIVSPVLITIIVRIFRRPSKT